MADIYGGKDPCDIPNYTFKDTAHHVGVPVSTLRLWLKGFNNPKDSRKPIINLPAGGGNMLSFNDLAQINVLTTIRRFYAIEPKKIREAIYRLREKFNPQYPLIEFYLHTDKVDLFVEELDRFVNLSNDQLAIDEVLKVALSRIDRDQHGRPFALYPFLSLVPPIDKRGALSEVKNITINPKISFGRPVLTGTGLRTRIISERHHAGWSAAALAEDYNVSVKAIEAGIEFEQTRRALAA